MNNLYIDCTFGIAGDMLLAALIDLGVPIEVVQKSLNKLGLDENYEIKFQQSNSCGFKGVKFCVELKEKNYHILNQLFQLDPFE